MKIGIAGVGVVGGTLMRWMRRNTNHELFLYDPDKGGMNDDLKQCEAVFICVPVPTVDGDQDLSIVKEIIKSLDVVDVSIVVRSTVLPGTCDRLMDECDNEVFACPEFLTERTCDDDMDKLPVIAGTGHGNTGYVNSLWQSIFFGKDLFLVTNKEAEMIKYAHNCFCAVKVNYFNIIYDQCQRLGIDYEEVKKNVGITGFIEPTHTDVPGHDGKFGFGGGCLPKDLDAFARFAAANNTAECFVSLYTVREENKNYFRKKESK